jgi:hypothetical protein
LPFAPLNGVIASVATLNNGVAFNNCIVAAAASGTVYPPTTGVLGTGSQLCISFTYQAA